MELTKHFTKPGWPNASDYLSLLLFFTIPFFHKFSNVVITVALVIPLIEIVRKGLLPKVQLHWFLPALFLYFLTSELISGGSWSSIEKRLQLLAVPLVFALNANFSRTELKPRIYLSFILGNLIAVCICLLRSIIRSFTFHDGGLIFNPNVIPDTQYDFLTSSVMGGNYFFANEYSYFHNPTYFAILIVYAQYLIFECLKSTNINRHKILLVTCYGVFFLALFLISSKAAIFSSLIISFWIILRVRIPNLVKISTFSGLVAVGVLFLLFNPRLKVFTETLKTHNLINPNARYGHDLRILSWDASLTLIKEKMPFGVGEGNKSAELMNVYKSKGYVTPAEQMLNSHNQYLDLLLGGGIVAFGLFVTGLIQLFTRSAREKNLAFLAFLFIFSFNALFENLLSRHMGILFFSIFISLFVTKRN